MQKFLKMITAVLLLICLTAAAGLNVPAAEDKQGTNIIPNNGFEELDEYGVPLKWLAYKGWDAGYASIDTERPYEGKNAIRVELEEGQTMDADGKVVYPWAKVCLTNFTPGAIYEIRGRANYAFSEGGSAHILIESYSDPNSGGPSSYIEGKFSVRMTGDTYNRWSEISGTWQAPKEARMIQVYLYLRGGQPGFAMLDNFELIETGGPEPYSKFTEEVFYYTDETEGYSSVELDSFYKPGDPEYDATVDFTLQDGDKVLQEARGVTFGENGKAEFRFDLSLMKEQEKQYMIYSAVYAPDGTVLNTFSDEVYIYPRPGAINKDGLYVLDNGEIFHPIYAYWPLDDFAKMKEIGINVIEMSTTDVDYLRKTLDELHALGMMGMVQLWAGPAWMEPAGHPTNAQTTKELVEALMDHPALFGWNLMDEPLGAGLKEDRVRNMLESYKIVRAIDKHHPTILVDYTPALYRESQKYCDFWLADLYVTGDTIRITNNMRQAVAAVRGRKPTMYVGQTFQNSVAFPNINDVRGGAYRAFEEGCTSLAWYQLRAAIEHDDGTRTPLDQTELWQPMVQFYNDEIGELFKYYSEKKYPTFNCRNDEDGHSFLYTSWVNDGDLWIIAHNRGNEAITAEVPLVSNNGLVRVGGGTAEAIGGTEVDLTVSGGVLKTEMKPQEVYLYKLKPDTAINVDALSIEVEKSSEGHSGKFEDLEGYEWAGEAIEAMFSAGITNETTFYSYSPGENITRGDFVMFLMRALGLSADGEGFADVPADAPYMREVTTGRALGILEGVGENLFSPEAEISRQDMMKIAARAMRYAGKLGEEADHSVLEAFSDKAQIADYAKTDMAAMVAAGIIFGNADGTVNPLGATTRAEAAVIMDRIIKAETVQKAPETEGTDTEEIPVVFAKETVTEEQTVKRAQAIEVLQKLNIADIQDGTAAVTRSEAARLVVRMLGYTGEMLPQATPFADVPVTHPDSGYIQMVNTLGIMRGTAENTFSPDAPIQYNQMVKILVDALGYTAHAEANGGYTAGYLFQANQLEITDGISVYEDGAIPAGTVALLLRNALDAPVAQRVSFGTDELKFVSSDKETALTVYHSLTRRDGMITATPTAVIEAPRKLHEGEVAMGQTVLYAGESGAENALGQTVVVYTRDSEDGTPEIILCEGKRNTETVVMDAKYLLPEKCSEDTLCWYDDTYKEYKEKFAEGAVMIYNGKAKAAFTGNDFDITDGTVTLLRSGAAVTTVIVDEYENHIVKSVSTTYNTVYFEDGTSLVVDVNDASKKVSLVNLSGAGIELSKVKKGHVLSVSESEDGSIIKLVHSNMKVSGTVTEYEQSHVIIDEKGYDIAYNLQNPAAGTLVPALGMEATYLLDKAGKICGVDASGAAVQYGYLVTMQKGKGISGDVKIRLFTAEGVTEYPVLAKKVKLNGVVMTPAEVYEAAALREADGKIRAQLVVYEKNAEDEIIELTTAKNAEGTGMDEAQRMSEFTLDWTSTGKTGSPTRFVKAFQYSIGDYWRWDYNTVVFCVPDGNEVKEEKYYSIFDLSDIDSSGTGIPNLHLYDIDENLYAPVIVSKQSGSSSAANEPDWSRGKRDGYLLIQDFRQVLNEDGEVITGISGWNCLGEEIVVPADPDKEILINNRTITTEDTSVKTVKVSELLPGDVIHFEEDDVTGELVAARVILRSNTPKIIEMSSDGVIRDFWNYSDGGVYTYGTVLGALETGLHVQAQFKRLWVWENYGSDAPIYLCEKTGTDAEGKAMYKIKKITQADIAAGDMAFVGAVALWNQMFVIYR